MRAGTDFSLTLVFQLPDTTPVPITNPIAEVRNAQDQSGTLILRFDDTHHLDQTVPGTIVLSVPESVTEALTAGHYYWDMFGTIGGTRVKLIDVSLFTIIGHVTLDTDPP